MKKAFTLADFMPKKLEQLAEKPLTILSFVTFEGSLCTMALVRYRDSDGEERSFTTGGKFVLEALSAADKANAFPLDAKFVKQGKAWTIVAAE